MSCFLLNKELCVFYLRSEAINAATTVTAIITIVVEGAARSAPEPRPVLLLSGCV